MNELKLTILFYAKQASLTKAFYETVSSKNEHTQKQLNYAKTFQTHSARGASQDFIESNATRRL